MEGVAATSSVDHVALAADIVSAYVSNNSIPAAELPNLIASVHGALLSLDGPQATPVEPEIEKPTTAQIRKSVSNNGIVSFIDGKTYQSLKRHLGTNGLDATAYRERYGLPADYPMTSPAYSAKRSELAKSLGLGQQRRTLAAPAPAPEPTSGPTAAEPRRRGRGKAKTAIAAE